jgi:hypothetical protein
MLIHNYAPPEFMHTVLIPIIKNKKGNIEDINNYRPIAITNVISKIFEGIMLVRLTDKLKTCHNQFGFKKGHSPDMCLFILRQIVDIYSNCSSPVYICFLDSSKAFDRLNFWVLFNTLIKKQVPIIFVRFLKTWYCTQQLIVRWCNCYSDWFNVGNGVRQGGILSPLIFSIYMDNLSTRLNDSKVGCFVNGYLYNHLVYADDTAIFAPSANALQKLLKICDTFSVESDIIYNVKKSMCMIVKPKTWKFPIRPVFKLGGRNLDFVEKYDYLGYPFHANLSDNDAILMQCRNLYVRGNTIIRNFRKCTAEVKCELFRSYCSSLYCSHLWYKFTAFTLQRLHVAYKGIFRQLFNLNYDSSISLHMTLSHIDALEAILRRNVYSFRARMYLSSNDLVKGILESVNFQFCNISKKWNSILYV